METCDDSGREDWLGSFSIGVVESSNLCLVGASAAAAASDVADLKRDLVFIRRVGVDWVVIGRMYILSTLGNLKI